MGRQSFDDPNSDHARQYLLDRRCERLHPKRHRTQKRSKALSAKKKRRRQFEAAQTSKHLRGYFAKVRAYWQGDADEHPPTP